jgi:hypothetical protein
MADSNARRKFQQRPDYLAQDFLDHLYGTGEPQSWRHNSHEPPPKAAVEVLVANFRVPKGHSRAPCPICQVEKKYLKGHLLWCPDSGTLHAVGHCCGHDYFGGNELERSLRDTARRAQQRADEALLWANWPLPGQLITLAADLRAQLRSCDRVITALRRSFPKPAYRALQEAGRTGGLLFVDRPASTQRGSREADRVLFSEQALRGLGWLTVTRAKSLEGTVMAATAPLEHFQWASEDDAVNWLMTYPDEMKSLRDHLEGAVLIISSVLQRMDELAAFLDPSNLGLLTRWAPQALGQGGVRAFRHGRELVLWRGTEGGRKVILPDNLWHPLPPPPRVMPPREGTLT